MLQQPWEMNNHNSDPQPHPPESLSSRSSLIGEVSHHLLLTPEVTGAREPHNEVLGGPRGKHLVHTHGPLAIPEECPCHPQLPTKSREIMRVWSHLLMVFFREFIFWWAHPDNVSTFVWDKTQQGKGQHPHRASFLESSGGLSGFTSPAFLPFPPVGPPAPPD